MVFVAVRRIVEALTQCKLPDDSAISARQIPEDARIITRHIVAHSPLASQRIHSILSETYAASKERECCMYPFPRVNITTLKAPGNIFKETRAGWSE